MEPAPGALLTDLYQLTMIQAYLDSGQTDTAVFEFFVRKLPPPRGFLMAAGLEQALELLENLRFTADELGWLEITGRFSARLIDYLANFRFSGDVHAMPEGTPFFQNEPILRVTAPLPEAQLVETRLINILHFQTLIASKAARMVQLAPDKLLVDFGLRRAHGADAGLMAARASYIAGFAGTATLLAEKAFGIPTYGTMAHSFIQSFDDEAAAFEAFARARPHNLTLLIDTYDTVAAARKVVALAPRLKELGISVRAVRIDSGDLAALAKVVRSVLDEGGLKDIGIFASGGIDEEILVGFARQNAPIDGIGIGTSLATSSDAPALDCAYKLQEYAGLPRRKRSTGKATWPGRKQVWRRYDRNGRMMVDILSVEGDIHEGEPLIHEVMASGRRIGPRHTLHDIRARARHELERLPTELRGVGPLVPYPVEVAASLEELAAVADRMTGPAEVQS
ncbi:nicotinate phosphoribosyltransferase [Bradyrhizobium sp. CCBAU 051011]|uniref:nicotinate phosphoribosyltransferase n=1 Tax=Bradyrhizobium sp. CCBAU 051011 TaxID=858422 RepID=UPI001373A455|nr:nicotinate phosphoribosyltransferase [Bradyrhizobium sp. CCBAU 051011]QHO75581.1 nicotinate phosphoribosyltransferase [Bradyrhizobium sp. CCBAU 051011]